MVPGTLPIHPHHEPQDKHLNHLKIIIHGDKSRRRGECLHRLHRQPLTQSWVPAAIVRTDEHNKRAYETGIRTEQDWMSCRELTMTIPSCRRRKWSERIGETKFKRLKMRCLFAEPSWQVRKHRVCKQMDATRIFSSPVRKWCQRCFRQGHLLCRLDAWEISGEDLKNGGEFGGLSERRNRDRRTVGGRIS